MGFTQWSHGTLHGKSSTLKETEWAMSESSWSPNTDVYELDGGLMIRVEIAGMRREDLQLKAEGNLLRISGTRPDQTRPPQSKFLLMEVHFGFFETSIELPSGYDLDEARALYENGFLTIEVPSVSGPSSKRIQIESLAGD